MNSPVCWIKALPPHRHCPRATLLHLLSTGRLQVKRHQRRTQDVSVHSLLLVTDKRRRDSKHWGLHGRVISWVAFLSFIYRDDSANSRDPPPEQLLNLQKHLCTLSRNALIEARAQVTARSRSYTEDDLIPLSEFCELIDELMSGVFNQMELSVTLTRTDMSWNPAASDKDWLVSRCDPDGHSTFIADISQQLVVQWGVNTTDQYFAKLCRMMKSTVRAHISNLITRSENKQKRHDYRNGCNNSISLFVELGNLTMDGFWVPPGMKNEPEETIRQIVSAIKDVEAPNSKAPNSKAPNSKAPNSKPPKSKAPKSKAPNSKPPKSKVKKRKTRRRNKTR